jgi:predicted TIM-barrel fold metal-dependent hydrolase
MSSSRRALPVAGFCEKLHRATAGRHRFRNRAKTIGKTKLEETDMSPAGGRIDVHVHSMPKTYAGFLRESALGSTVRIPEWSPDLALAMMERHGIAAAVTSLSVPGTNLGDDAKARDVARRCNEEAAEIAAKNPRIGAFATLPLPHVEFACAEAIHALDVLKLDGVGLLTGYAGKYLGDSHYDPLMDALNARGATVHIHPAVHPSTKFVQLGVPNFMLEYPFDTTRCATNMVFADIFERYPRINFILSHGGGALPFLAWRISAIAQWQLAQPPASESFLRDNFRTPLIDRLPQISADEVRGLLGRYWYDVALAPDRGAVAALREIADPGRILFGSDWP